MFEKEKLSLFCLLVSIGVMAQQQAPQIALDTIVLEAFRITTQKEKLPFSVTQLSFTQDQPSRATLTVDPFLVSVPGVYVLNSSNFAQDSRIAIRGFGSRAAFGIRGIQLIVDGIPETTPDGQGQVDNLSLALLNRLTVLRGPQAALYGNASGGVLQLSTMDQLPFGKAEAQLRFGDFGLQQQYVTYAQQKDNSQWIAHLGRTKTNGYREQSGMESRQLQLRGKRTAKNSGVWRWQFNYTDSPYAQDAGGLTLEEAKQNRTQARQRNVTYKTEESVRQWKSGLQYSQQNGGLQWQLHGFAAGRDFEALLPFANGGAVQLDRFYTGQGGHLEWGKRRANSSVKLQWGYDVAHQNDARKRFVNAEGVRGAATLDQQEVFFNAATYLLLVWKKNHFDFVGGLRKDWNTLRVNDRFLSDGDATDTLVLNALNPSLGVTFALYPAWQLFSNISTAFETPSLSELSADPKNSGGFNSALKSQKTLSYELGLRWKNTKTQFEIVSYWMRTNDELTPYELAEFQGRTFYQNAGSSSREGVEVAVVHQFRSAWQTTLSYTYSNFRYERFITPRAVYSGNQLPGIPKHFGALQLHYAKAGWQGLLGLRYSGDVYADNANTTSVSAWHTLDINLQRQYEKNNWRWIPFVGIQNATNQQYFDTIRLNAFGQRYYEPAAQRNFFAGIKFQW